HSASITVGPPIFDATQTYGCLWLAGGWLLPTRMPIIEMTIPPLTFFCSPGVSSRTFSRRRSSLPTLIRPLCISSLSPVLCFFVNVNIFCLLFECLTAPELNSRRPSPIKAGIAAKSANAVRNLFALCNKGGKHFTAETPHCGKHLRKEGDPVPACFRCQVDLLVTQTT